MRDLSSLPDGWELTLTDRKKLDVSSEVVAISLY